MSDWLSLGNEMSGTGPSSQRRRTKKRGEGRRSSSCEHTGRQRNSAVHDCQRFPESRTTSDGSFTSNAGAASRPLSAEPGQGGQPRPAPIRSHVPACRNGRHGVVGMRHYRVIGEYAQGQSSNSSEPACSRATDRGDPAPHRRRSCRPSPCSTGPGTGPTRFPSASHRQRRRREPS